MKYTPKLYFLIESAEVNIAGLMAVPFDSNLSGKIRSSFGVEFQAPTLAPGNKGIRINIDPLDKNALCCKSLETIFGSFVPLVIGERRVK